MGTILVKSALNALKIQFSGTFFVSDIFLKRYEFDFMIIYDQWPKLHLGLDVPPEISVLKGL